jgi:dTDP-glucose 4,6-dehydratase
VVIFKVAAGDPIPLYGDGGNVCDWLYEVDHVEALLLAATLGLLLESYCIGGVGYHGAPRERTNVEPLQAICELMN